MSLVAKQAIFLRNAFLLHSKACEIGFIVTGGELYRTEEQQALYLKSGKSKAKTSQHQNRLAIDFNFFRMIDGRAVQIEDVERLKPLGEYWASLDKGNTCGILWGWDTNHFEWRQV